MEKINKSKSFLRCGTTEQTIPVDLSKEITKMFNVKTKRNKRISEYMCEKIRKTKMKALQSKMESWKPIPTRPSTINDFRRFAERCSTSDMTRFLERQITHKIQAKGLEDKYPILLADCFVETKLEYKKILHYAGKNQIVCLLCCLYIK